MQVMDSRIDRRTDGQIIKLIDRKTNKEIKEKICNEMNRLKKCITIKLKKKKIDAMINR